MRSVAGSSSQIARDTLPLMRSLGKRKLFGVLLLVGLVVAIVTTAGLVELHDEILEASSQQVDQALQSWVHGFSSPALTRLMQLLSLIGSPFVLAPAVMLAALWMVWRGLKDDAVLVVVAAFGGVVLDEVMKLHFKRLRPD